VSGVAGGVVLVVSSVLTLALSPDASWQTRPRGVLPRVAERGVRGGDDGLDLE